MIVLDKDFEDMTEVIVQLAPRPELIEASNKDRKGPFLAARRFGLRLEAIHPETSDPSLSRWFHVKVESAKASEIIRALLEIPDVTAAYVKPGAEPP